MSNTQDIMTGMGDEALDTPTLEAFGAACNYPCLVSDEALDPAPVQDVAGCMPVYLPCMISDEALDPAPVQEATFCTPGGYCFVSDEALDPAPAQSAIASMAPSCHTCYFCTISDEVHAAN